MKLKELIASIHRMHVPPECQGQIVEWSYGWTDDGLPVRRAHDKGDGETRYWYGKDQCPDDYEPWNCEPSGVEWIEAK